MAQQTLNPVSTYGRSGSILLLNPTDRSTARYVVPVPGVGSLNAREARDPRVIRATYATPPLFADGSAASTATVTTLTPATGVHGTPDALCTVTGTGFNTGTVVLWGLVEVATTFVDATHVTFFAPLSSSLAGTVAVGVRNPGQVKSGTQNYTVT